MSVTPRPPQGPRAPRALVAAVVVLVAALGLPARPAAADPAPVYRPPVDAPVSDPFRPPTVPYGPGNRGLEYDTTPGTEVRAAADGEVTFAGTVAGTRHVTVRHADGLRTTASRLATVAVVAGQRVRQGDRLGTTEGRLHFGARAGDAYLDPASLFVEGPPKVRLVPFDTPPGIGIGGERSAIRQLLGLGSAVVGWAGDQGGEALRTALHYAPIVLPPLRAAALGVRAADALAAAWVQATRPCTSHDVDVAPPAERRLAILVAGLGSTSTSGSIDDLDTTALGYEPDDTVRFSYAGGRTPGSTGHPADVPARHYDAADSQQDLRTSGARLADLVEAVAARNPGVPIDLLAHSQGGLVSRLAIAELERRGSADVLGMLGTMATPHGGADIATMGRVVGTTSFGGAIVDGLVGPAGLDPSLPAIAQLSEGSDLVHELADTPLPADLEAISVAGRTDVVVPVPRTRLDGAREVVVSLDGSLNAHSDLPGHPGTARELALALAGAPPGCRGFLEAVADQGVGAGLSALEDTVAPLVGAAGAVGTGVGAGVGTALDAAGSALAPAAPRR